MKELIEQCELELRAGRVNRVVSLLRGLNPKKVDRKHQQKLAAICRRSGLFLLGLRILSPVIVAPTQTSRATAEEAAEYAGLLEIIGSTEEAISDLLRVDPAKAPQALLYLSHCYMSRWEYEKAEKTLEQLLGHEISQYLRSIARVNLAASQIACQRADAAKENLDQLIPQLKNEGALRLVANSLELRAQIWLQRDQLIDCERDLNSASGLLSASQTTDQLYVSKWKYLLESQRTKSIEPLQEFRRLAVERRHWESVRDADFRTLKLTLDFPLLRQLYFGTPHPAYRAIIARELGVRPLASHYEFGREGGRSLDLSSGELDGRRVLSLGGKPHQLLLALSSDRYAPLSIGALFSSLFPDERFNSSTSPNRVHQILFSTRRWISEADVPLVIEEEKGRFSLSIAGDLGVKVATRLVRRDRVDAAISSVRDVLGSSFSSKELQGALKISEPTARRIIQAAIERSQVVLQRDGKHVSYRFCA